MALNLFLRKRAADVTAETEANHGGLKRTLGAFDLTMLGIGAIVGAGLFSTIKEMITGRELNDGSMFVGAGPGVTLSFVLTAIACGFAALCYAEISAMIPVSGSAYSYSYVAFGELIAWIIGWDLIVEYAIGNVYVAQSWSDYFQTFVHNLFGVDIPKWLALDFQSAANKIAKGELSADLFPTLFGRPFAINVPAAAITILLTILLYRGVKESTRVNAAMVFLKVGLVLAFIGIGVFHVDSKNWSPFMPNGFAGVWHGAALGFFAYIGFDAVSTASEECKNPQRDLPRGLLWSLGICTALYIATAAVLTGMVPNGALKSQDPLAEALNYVGLTGSATAIAFGAVIAMSAVLLVFQLGQTRIFYVMARDGLLPKVFAKIHPKHRTPHVNTWVTGIVVALLCSILTPDQAIGLCNIGTLFAFILVSIGVIVLRKTAPDQPRPFKIPGYPVTPLLSAGACLALILGLERTNLWRFVIWLALGLIVYFAYGVRHSVLRRGKGS
jgi:basic amino acid/polyamine antiporter, APA family